MLYNDYFPDTYSELLSYYPRFYWGIKEMQAILSAEGNLADGVKSNIELVLNNCFIDTADEATIKSYEKDFSIGLDRGKTLEERRKVVKMYLIGGGKFSASSIKTAISSYTGAEVDITFEPFDSDGNNRLNVSFEKGRGGRNLVGDVLRYLSRVIPAHIEYRAYLLVRAATVVNSLVDTIVYKIDLCGTMPGKTLNSDQQEE